MARGVQRLHCDSITDRECFAMARGLGDFRAVFAADDGQREGLQDLGVSTGVIVVAGLA